MALYYSKGRISFISEVKTGTSQSGFKWQNCDVTLDVPGYQGSITKQVFRASGDKVDAVLQYKVGDTVQIGFSLYAREWNNRLFNNVDLVTITDEAGAKPAPAEDTAEKPAKKKPAEKSGFKFEAADHPEDLPF